MGIPVWTTLAGDLGTIQEGAYYQIELEGFDPDGGALQYNIIAGFLPSGLKLNQNSGLIEGILADVANDQTSVFVCRITSISGSISDRTFSITVTGQDAPEIITTDRLLATVLDGSRVDIALEARDLDNEPLSWSLTSGELPPGLQLDSNTGVISGYALPTVDEIFSSNLGWSSESGWNEIPWDAPARWVNKSYQFSVAVTDGKQFDRANYSIIVLAKSLITADSDFFSADNISSITADQTTKRVPAITTAGGNLGIYAHDNYFSFQFKALDFDQEPIQFGLTSGDGLGFDNFSAGFDVELFDQGGLSLPPGLTFDSFTGWLYGYITPQIPAQTEYNFAVYAYKSNDPSMRSKLVYFSITIVSDLAQALIWRTDSDLGVIRTGEISELAVEAFSQLDVNITYRLLSGSRLPQGLRLLENGLIVGRSSFEVTSFDGNKTTFDENSSFRGSRVSPMRFDQAARFTVQATSANRRLVATRTFTVRIIPSSQIPYENLYLRAQPGAEIKNLFQRFVNNTDAIPTADLYRNGDPNFGRSKDIRMLLIAGLRSSTASEYIQAMSTNHYRKTLRIGSLQVNQAFDQNRQPVYDVLYFDLEDEEIGSAGTQPLSKDLTNSISRSTLIDSNQIKIDNQLLNIDGAGSAVVYPNSFDRMRRALQEKIGSDLREPLPRWMSDRQADGSTIGWKPAMVLAYLKPGAGDRVLFNIRRLQELIDPKLISFEVDRYIWDCNLSEVYDPVTGQFLPSVATTFDSESKTVTAPVATVDFALEVPFTEINGRSTAYIDSRGGLDGLVLPYEGRTVIFAQQEKYLGNTDPEDGWIRSGALWDDTSGWDNQNISGWDDYTIIPGYVQSEATPGIVNQRGGIWKFVRDENQIWNLEFVQELAVGENVLVRNGAIYGGYICGYDPNIQFERGETVPRWRRVEAPSLTKATIFDGGNTRFINNVSIYQQPDENDKYLVFPRNNVWA